MPKQTTYRRASLRNMVRLLRTEDEMRDFVVRINEEIKAGKIRMSPNTRRKLTDMLYARRDALRKATLYGPDGRPIVREGW